MGRRQERKEAGKGGDEGRVKRRRGGEGMVREPGGGEGGEVSQVIETCWGRKSINPQLQGEWKGQAITKHRYWGRGRQGGRRGGCCTKTKVRRRGARLETMGSGKWNEKNKYRRIEKWVSGWLACWLTMWVSG